MLSLSFTGVLMVGFACMAYTKCAKDYDSALKKSILFFDAQRSGKLPADNPISWRGDSALNDCVTGGWYDAGDHIKFTLPMSASTTILLWSLNRFKDAYSSSGTLDQMYDMVKWPLDFFLKAWDPTAKTLVAQVGDGNADHGWWGRPEDMTMARPCTYISATEKGSDISGGVAAALAAGAIVFKDKGDTAYSSQLLSAAESLYAFAKANRGISNASHGLYDSYSEKDEMCEASLFLHKATQKSNYLDDAKTYLENYPPWSFDWENKQVFLELSVTDGQMNRRIFCTNLIAIFPLTGAAKNMYNTEIFCVTGTYDKMTRIGVGCMYKVLGSNGLLDQLIFNSAFEML